MIQRTLILLKPDCVQRQFCGEIITRFEKAGFKIVGMKLVKPNENQFAQHYADVKDRHGEKIFNNNLKAMIFGPIVAMVLEGANAIESVRKMIGSTEPRQALPGTIRGDYSHQSYAIADKNDIGVKNLIHASADEADAQREVSLWFTNQELYDYKTVHDVHLF
ncbi:nucleoside-diphosphate kinase [Candidatus Woesearchaeota archaeon]|nr:nucleoside-diphosphate kinase [Candidatus Woesearchaeota archaeon]